MRSTVMLGGLAGLAAAQFPPEPQGLKVLKSKLHENVTISYKEPTICEGMEGVKSYAGHVHLPPGFLDDTNGEKQDYPVNTFFYFFEARIEPETAPLAIWLNGGPGGSSMLGLFQENGPCILNNDSQTTEVNPWSWNTYVNMLYIDEPNQVGFSYDTPTNVTYDYKTDRGDLEGYVIVPHDFSDGVPESTYDSRVGRSSSQKMSHTTNSTAQAAHALWHFAQTWFTEFPHYKPENDKISLWAESYGGHYGPAFFRFFQEQNEKIRDGSTEDENAHELHLDTLGIVNGYLDTVVQGESWISFPYNNTFDIQVFDEDLYQDLMHNWTKPDGCKDRIKACQEDLKAYDVATLNRGFRPNSSICYEADACSAEAINHYLATDHGWMDIAQPQAEYFPGPEIHGYLSQESVLQEIGSPVNFTWLAPAVANSFAATHDIVHGGFLDAVAYLLDSGVKVHMMYGDRDYACNWVGGEAASLAVPYSRQKDFAEAAYGLFWTSDGFSGINRQLGNFSFTRVFQAGHMVPSFQPVAAYEVFMRATFNRDIGSGTIPVNDDLTNDGEAFYRWIKQDPPEKRKGTCYVLNPWTCTPEEWQSVVDGKVTVENYYVTEYLDGERSGGEGSLDEL